jgi:glycine C-acetyltransferase
MPVQGLTLALAARLEEMAQSGRLKGNEAVISRIIPARGAHGPRYVIEGEDRLFLRMNSNSYLGMGLRAEIIEAEERGADT